MSGDQKGPKKSQDPGPGEQTGGVWREVAERCNVCEQLLSLLDGKRLITYMPTQEPGSLVAPSYNIQGYKVN